MVKRVIEILILLLGAWFVWQLPVYALTDAQAIKAVMGEARGESLAGKTAVAECLRRRGNLHGVYGANISQTILNREKPSVWRDAAAAWRVSETSNLVPWCKYWFSDADLIKLNKKRPRWFRQLHFIRKIGNQSFYAS